jgi:hypothetical protein
MRTTSAFWSFGASGLAGTLENQSLSQLQDAPLYIAQVILWSFGLVDFISDLPAFQRNPDSG